MTMVIVWQTINAVRRPSSRRFTRGFLVVTPGLTIRDRLKVLQPNDPDSYYQSRELIPSDMLADLDRAKIVIIISQCRGISIAEAEIIFESDYKHNFTQVKAGSPVLADPTQITKV